MASDKRTPSPNPHTSHSIVADRAVRPSSEAVATPATPVPLASAHPPKIDSEDLSPTQLELQAGRQSASASANEKPPPQGAPQMKSHCPSNLAGVGYGGASHSPKHEDNRGPMGTPAHRGQSYVDRSYNYMRKYPHDAEGKELEPDARVWKVYLDECESYDNDMIKGFRDTIDSLLVFVLWGRRAKPEPDYAQIGASLLFEQIEVLRATGNAARIQEIPRSPWTPDSITRSSLDVAINWLFFASLAFSLATAFIAVLMKQWLQAFTTLVPGDAKVRSLTRQFRFTGLQKWKLPEIINFLPLFLHLALALFLIGLCLVSKLHPSITMIVGVVTCAAIAFYVTTGALPALHLDCPYRAPILFIPACLVVYTVKMIRLKMANWLQKQSSVGLPPFSLTPLNSQEQPNPNTSVQRIALYGVNRFLKAEALQYLDENTDLVSRAWAISLRDSLPLQSMSLSALRFCAPEAQLEDGPLLRELVLSIRRLYDGPVLAPTAWSHVIRTPYPRVFLQANIIQESDLGWHGRFPMLVEALESDKWDVVTYLVDSPSHSPWNPRHNGCCVLAFASASEVISHDDWAAIFTITKQWGIDFNTYPVAIRSWSKVLHLVSSYGTVAAVEHLIYHVPNLDFNVVDSYGSTPLHFACDRGKDYPDKDQNGHTPLWYVRHLASSNQGALAKPVPFVIQTLLSAGADPNIVDKGGCLPLHNACSNAFRDFSTTEAGLKVIEELLKATANINQRTKDGLTPLDLLEESDRRNTEEGKAGYSLMRQHRALLAKELAQVEEGKLAEDKEVEEAK